MSIQLGFMQATSNILYSLQILGEGRTKYSYYIKNWFKLESKMRIQIKRESKMRIQIKRESKTWLSTKSKSRILNRHWTNMILVYLPVMILL